MALPAGETYSKELEKSFLLLNQAFALADFLCLNVFVGIEVPSQRRFWSTNGKRLKFDFMSNELQFRDADFWLKPGRLAGEEVISKDSLYNLTTDWLTNAGAELKVEPPEERGGENTTDVASTCHAVEPSSSMSSYEAPFANPVVSLVKLPEDRSMGPIPFDKNEPLVDCDHYDGVDSFEDVAEAEVDNTLMKEKTAREATCSSSVSNPHAAAAEDKPSTSDNSSKLETPVNKNPTQSTCNTQRNQRRTAVKRAEENDTAREDSVEKKEKEREHGRLTEVNFDKAKNRRPRRARVKIESPNGDSSVITCKIIVNEDDSKCGASFASEEQYSTHYRDTHCVCKVCLTTHSSHRSLRKHYWRNHVEQRPHMCASCGKGFAFSYELKLHERVVRDGVKNGRIRRACDIDKKCRIRSEKKAVLPSLPEHEALYKSVAKCKPTNECAKINLTCIKCKQRFATREERLVHYKEVHATCHLCQAVFKEGASLRRHILTKHDKIKKFECSVCHLKFAFQSSLDSHFVRHSGEKKFVCSQCGQAFARSGQLNSHVKYSHLRLRNHACPHCPGKYFSKHRLLLHVKTVHDKIKDHECPQCDRRFPSVSAARQHEARVHREDRPFDCPTCGKAFKIAAHLRRHGLTHGTDLTKDESLANLV